MKDHAQTSGQDGNCEFHTVFHTGHHEVLFFPELHISSAQQLLGACVVVFLMALFNEGLRLFVSWLQSLVNSPQQALPQSALHPTVGSQQHQQPAWVLGTAYAFTHILHLLSHYCLMLVFMTLNVWLCLSLLLGAGAGLLLFHFRPVQSRVFRFLGFVVREHPRKEGEDGRADGNGSEMMDFSGGAEGRLWNGGPKEK